MKGFSLIELLVALAVFALVVVALLHLAGESTRSAMHIEENVLANLVADNLAAEAMLSDADRLATPAQGTLQLAGRDWYWRRTATATAQGMLRVDIAVGTGGSASVLASAEVFR